MATRRLANTLADRAVHIKLTPRTINIHQSREVLRVLKRFGEVVSFRNLRFDSSEAAPNTILAIYQDPGSASQLIAASPISFPVPARPPYGPVVSPASINVLQALGPLPEIEADKVGRRRSGAESLAATSDRQFLLTADASFRDHQAYIERQKYYWGYESGEKSFVREDLARHVPVKGMEEISLRRVEIPQRIVDRNKSDVARRPTLRELQQGHPGGADT